ncbi:MAG: DUF2007 domain-containing protein [Dehalogenimonas sp.]|uniref:DUF2007 domain-containing protein n=1 Tax=Candidatus Dehalogenimonas loeffleri TaxID=3127115 RepID=A0ABZ2J5A0_9CHLR|nr:DUF2007 domain-containing protein [Dehalogenimonas sp.]
MADNEWVAAATADNEFAATLWRDILVDSGIPAYIESSGSATFLQVASALMPRRVMVPQEKLEEARAVLADIEEVDTPPVESDEADDA